MKKDKKQGSAAANSCAPWVPAPALRSPPPPPLASEAAATETPKEAKKTRYNRQFRRREGLLPGQPLLSGTPASGRRAGMPADAVMPISVVSKDARPRGRGRTTCGGRSACCRMPPPASAAACSPRARAGRNTTAASSTSNCSAAKPRAISPTCRRIRRVCSSCCGATKNPNGLAFTPFLVTVCPYEAMGYSEGNDDVVEGVPMPPEMMAWVQEFVAAPSCRRAVQETQEPPAPTTITANGRPIASASEACREREQEPPVALVAAQAGGAPRRCRRRAVADARAAATGGGASAAGRRRAIEPEAPVLPSVDELDFQSDYTAFLAKNVPEALRRAALRKLWMQRPGAGQSRRPERLR